MFAWSCVSLLTLLHVTIVCSDPVCSVLQHMAMQADFLKCSRMFTEEHFNSEEGDMCELMNSVVGKCGELWQRCYTSREVRRMRDLHIEDLVMQYGAKGGLDRCHIVKKYRYGEDNFFFMPTTCL